MVDISNIQKKATNNILTDIDRHVYLKFLKEKKTSRTYICGLHNFMTNEEIDKFVKSLKKTLGTGENEKKAEKANTFEYKFQDDCKDKIKKYLVTKFPDIEKYVDDIVIIKYNKEKVDGTYVCKLYDYVEEDEIRQFIKYVQKDLDVKLLEKKISKLSDISCEYGFQGDHRDTIKKYIMANTSIPEKKIRVQ